jgi:hypothetical protein
VGGPGSGNRYHHWWRASKKTVVEDCRFLDANRWMRDGILKGGVYLSGSCCWYRDAGQKEQVAALGFEVNTLDPAFPWVRLSYTITATQEDLNYRVGLTTTRPRFGGLRWWFVCPLVVRGRPCGRRIGKLYLPPRSRYFGCRHCYDLTYTSCQEHDKRVDWLRKNPKALRLLAENPEGASVTQLGLILKALRP